MIIGESLIERVPGAQRAVFERAVQVLAADARVMAVWLHGSIARGDADEMSDVDLLVAVEDSAVSAWSADWRALAQQIVPRAVLCVRLPFGPGSWHAISTRWERIDVVCERASDVGVSIHRDRLAVFDRDGLDHKVPAAVPDGGPSGSRLTDLAQQFVDAAAVHAEARDRQDSLLEAEAGHGMRWRAYEIFCEAAKPRALSGLKHWSAKLVPRHRQFLEAVPMPDELAAEVAAVLEHPLPSPSGADDPAPALIVPFRLVAWNILGADPASDAVVIANELWRIHGLLPVITHREDWLLGWEGVWTLRRLFYEMCVTVNAAERPGGPPAGDDQWGWSSRLTTAQRDQLESLPAGAPSRSAVVGGHLAVRDAFAELAPGIAPDLEAACRAHVGRHIDQE